MSVTYVTHYIDETEHKTVELKTICTCPLFLLFHSSDYPNSDFLIFDSHDFGSII
jgi:hypothetical protein